MYSNNVIVSVILHLGQWYILEEIEVQVPNVQRLASFIIRLLFDIGVY